MLRGAQYSAIFHVVLLVLIIVGLPDFFKPERREEPVAISVEILPVSDISNVPNRTKQTPKPKKEEPPKPPKKEEVKKPEPPVKKEKKVVEAKKPEPVPTPEPEKPKEPEKKKEEKKPEEKPKPKEEDKKPAKDEEEDLMAVLKAVKETAKDQQPDDSSETEENESPSRSDNAFIDSLPLSMSEKDAIRNQIAKCWNVPAGAKDAHELVVVLRLTFEKDGSLITAYLHKPQQGRYNSDSFFRAAVDSAMRAVRACTPLQGMPLEKYQSWKDVELTFDPKDLLY